MNFEPYTELEFSAVSQQAHELAKNIRSTLDDLIDILLEYESHEVATDEIARTLDLLDSLEENESFFKLRIGAVTTFLPRNQPLYALTCFVLIPSLQASTVHYRTPHSLRDLLPKVVKLLQIDELFPNVIVSHKERLEFLKERSALTGDKSGNTRPVTDAVIFTGTPKHAHQLRLVFDNRTLFITNGAGHNPIVVGKGANIEKVVATALTLTLYNQGQDCAAPNAILVHAGSYKSFMNELHSRLADIKIGHYRDRDCRVGPISNPLDLPHIQSILVENRRWIDEQTGGVINTSEGIVEPTIITKPLEEGGNYTESFAPFLFIQKYAEDKELARYFETEQYREHAMYITLYGESDYVQNLIKEKGTDDLLHTNETFLHNTHLHAAGIERGTKQYGGYGIGASSLSINGAVTPKPTLPQRDIYEILARPLLDTGNLPKLRETIASYTTVLERKVEKLLRLQNHATEARAVSTTTNMYCDTTTIDTTTRFSEIASDDLHRLLDKPNIEYIATLNPQDIEHIKLLRRLLLEIPQLNDEEFKNQLYDIPKQPDSTKNQNSKRQRLFFQHIYRLLFNQDTGPRLAPFLYEIHTEHVDKLLDV